MCVRRLTESGVIEWKCGVFRPPPRYHRDDARVIDYTSLYYFAERCGPLHQVTAVLSEICEILTLLSHHHKKSPEILVF